jgi:hypothetical protein
MNKHDEAHYHFVLSDMADLVDEYGYASVINDLDEMIAAKANAMLCLNEDGVPLIYEEMN